jgi:iron complex outermembrane receptor protein
MKKSVLTAITAFFCFCVYAQTKLPVLQGKVVDSSGTVIKSAIVKLLKGSDSTLIKISVTDSMGTYLFNEVESGRYMISVSHTGYSVMNTWVTVPSDIRQLSVPELSLHNKINTLQEVTVNSSKPILEIRADKLVFNVEGSNAGIGNNLMELLQKSPGVVVDNNDNISMNGKSGVAVYIDGRPSYLTGADLSAYLRSKQANQVEALELITNPSSRFDASGTGGVINFKMKKDKGLGTTGTFTIGYNIGTYSKYNTGITVNQRSKKLNIYGSYNNNFGLNSSFFDLYRKQSDSVYDQKSINLNDYFNHNLKTGVDWNLSKEKTAGIMIDAGISNFETNGSSQTPISAIATNQTNRILFAESRQTGNRQRFNGNLNYRFSNNKGKDFNVDADYGFFKNGGNSIQPNYYTDAGAATIKNKVHFRIYTLTQIDILALKTDYEQNCMAGKLSLGIKISGVKTNNIFEFYDSSASGEIFNSLRSRVFTYSESILASYINYQKQTGKLEYQIGLRAEQTNSRGILKSEQVLAHDDISRRYLNLFPSAGVQYKLSKKSSIGLTFSRRIERPTYQTLNPFENRVDELTYQKGNPFLKPQYTNSLELLYTPFPGFSIRSGYSVITDYFAQIKDTVETNRNFIAPVNLQKNEVAFVGVNYSYFFTKWWGGFASPNLTFTKCKGDFGRSGLVNLNAVVFNIYNEQRFILNKKLSLRLSGSYRSNSIYSGTYRSDPYWFVDASLRQSVCKGNGTLQFSVSDIFFSAKYRSVGSFPALLSIASGGYESRLCKLSFSYRFGNNNVKESRQRRTSNTDENNRVETL